MDWSVLFFFINRVFYSLLVGMLVGYVGLIFKFLDVDLSSYWYLERGDCIWLGIFLVLFLLFSVSYKNNKMEEFYDVFF